MRHFVAGQCEKCDILKQLYPLPNYRIRHHTLLLVAEGYEVAELGTEAFGFSYVAMLDRILKKEICLLNLLNQVVTLGHCHFEKIIPHGIIFR